MRSCLLAVVCLFAVSTMSGCTRLATDVDLGKAAQKHGMKNITTGDGTFENYTAVDHHRHLEVGISVGIPYLCKLIELYPVQSNQAQLEDMAGESKAHGANAMINVCPPTETYTGFPFFIVGLHFDRTSGTGINQR
jgi:hypothetical protein